MTVQTMAMTCAGKAQNRVLPRRGVSLTGTLKTTPAFNRSLFVSTVDITTYTHSLWSSARHDFRSGALAISLKTPSLATTTVGPTRPTSGKTWPR